MEHHIITRYNVKWKNINNYDKWMNERVNLFSKYLLSSLMKQKNKNFKLIICIDTNTHSKYLKILEDRIEKKINYELLKCNNIAHMKNQFKERYSKKKIILSRIDSDDCVSPDYSNNIREFFNNPSNLKFVFDYSNIYYYSTSTGEVIDVSYPRPTMFSSSIGSFYIPYSHSHDLIEKYIGKRVKRVALKDVCCVCHDGNISNNVNKSKSRFKYLKAEVDLERWIK